MTRGVGFWVCLINIFSLRVVEFLRIDDRVDGVSINSSYDFSVNDIAWFFRTTSEGIAILKPVRNESGIIEDFSWVFTNSVATRIFDRELVGNSFLTTFHLSNTDVKFKFLLKVFEEGLSEEGIFNYNQENSSLWLNVNTVKLRDSLMLSVRDISNEISLTESEERYRFMVESIPHLIWTADSSGKIDFKSKQWADFTGLVNSETKGYGWFEYVHPLDFDKTLIEWNNAIENKAVFKVEHRILNSNGEYRWFKSNSKPMFDIAGNLYKWMGSSTDIHEEMIHLEELTLISRELEEKNDTLERINNDLDTFVYTASHDLTAPINNIEGLTSLIRFELSARLDDRQLEYLDLMTQSINNLHGNIRDLTEIISIKQDTGREKEAIFFTDILKNIEEDLFPVISVLKAEINTDFKVKSMLYARKNIRTILFNLISNALKYRSPDRPTIIHISTSKINNMIVLEVSDNGTGISEDQMPQMFGIFKRFHKDIHGHGVGLYMIKRIIENNGGHIEVKSEINKGTVFQVYFTLSH